MRLGRQEFRKAIEGTIWMRRLIIGVMLITGLIGHEFLMAHDAQRVMASFSISSSCLLPDQAGNDRMHSHEQRWTHVGCAAERCPVAEGCSALAVVLLRSEELADDLVIIASEPLIPATAFQQDSPSFVPEAVPSLASETRRALLQVFLN
jgi:hypothetical protein